MRRPLLLVGLCMIAAPLLADDLLQPEQYLAIMTESKLRYVIGTSPAQAPMPQIECGRRDASTRVVASRGEKKLVDWTVRPEAVALIEEAEPLFQAKQYDDAAKLYLHAIEIDPQAVVAYFNYGDTLLWGKHDAAAALVQYQKGIALDPTLAMGYFFTSTAYMHLGRTADAREAIIKALALHPAYKAVWQIAEKNPRVWGVRPIVRHPFEPPQELVGRKTDKGIEIYVGPNAQWLGYAICKAVWANEPRFAKTRGGEGFSLDEERACVFNQLTGTYNRTAAKLDEEEKKRGVAKPDVAESAVVAAMPPLERHLYDVTKSQLLDGYILFEVIGQRCPIAMSLMADDARRQTEDYIRKYIMVPEAEGQAAAIVPPR